MFSVVVVQSLSCVRLFVIPWTATHQASLFFTISQSLLKLKSIELVMPSNHLILCCPLLFLPPMIHSITVWSFPVHQPFPSGGQIIGASASALVLPMNIQDWFALGLTVWSPCSPRDSQDSSPTPQHQLFGSQLSLYSNSHIHIWLLEKNIVLTRWTFVGKAISLLFNTMSRFVTAFLPRSMHLLISWLQSQSAVFGDPQNKICYCFHCLPMYLPYSDGTRCHDLRFLNVEFYQLFHSPLSLLSKASLDLLCFLP